MSDVSELDQTARLLQVSWNKANNYYVSFAKSFLETKKRFDSGEFPGWTYAMWLGQKAGLMESQVLKQLKNFNNVISGDDNRSIDKEAERLECERNADKLAKLEAKRKQADAERKIRADIAAGKEAERLTKKAKRDADNAERERNRAKAAKLVRDKAYRERKAAALNQAKPDKQSNETKTLSGLADGVRFGQARIAKGKVDFVEGTLQIASCLCHAREVCKSDKRFGQWLTENKFDYDSHARAAYIHFGMEPDLARSILEITESTSPRYIWEQEMQPKSKVVTMSGGMAT